MLLTTIAATPPTTSIPFRDSNDMLGTKLLEFAVVWNRQSIFPMILRQHCSSLLQKIASSTSDLDLWSTIYELIIAFGRPTTPLAATTQKSDALGTPARSNSVRCLTESQTHKIVDPYLRLELTDAVYIEVNGFGRRLGTPDFSAE